MKQANSYYSYSRYEKRSKPRPRRFIKFKICFTLFLVAIYAVYACLRPVTYAVHISITPPNSSKQAKIDWPMAGQAALGIEGQGVVAASPNERKTAIASITKVITALAILEKKPLKPDEQGGTIRFTDKDVAICQRVASQDGVAIGVLPGQSMTERQALEAMLLKSANNIAVSLGNWAFGSEKAYADYTNNMLKRLGFKQTHVNEASGLDTGNVSTPSELLKLAKLVMDSPVLAAITSKNETTISGFGTIKNGSHLVGMTASVHGIKTGLNDAAGYCLLFWINPNEPSTPKPRIFGVILGQGSFREVVAQANTLAEKAVPANFTYEKVASKGETVAVYRDNSGSGSAITAPNDILLPHWRGKDIKVSVLAQGPQPKLEVKTAGAVKTYDLALNSRPKPTMTWRLTHPY